MSYAIAYDAAARLLTLSMSGFWDEPTTSAFQTEITALFAHLQHLPDHGGLVLVDASGFEVQAPATIERIAAMTNAVSGKVDRFALLNSGSALQRRQIERVLPPDRLRVFSDRAAALEWLNGSTKGPLTAQLDLHGSASRHVTG